MKKVYPIILTKDSFGYLVTIPDFNINTQGRDLAEAIFMARDAIGLMGIDMEEEGKELPEATEAKKINENDIVTLVDIDFTEYRKKADNRAVKKNCTIPHWLSVEAEKAGINFSRVLQEALIEKLNAEK